MHVLYNVLISLFICSYKLVKCSYSMHVGPGVELKVFKGHNLSEMLKFYHRSLKHKVDC